MQLQEGCLAHAQTPAPRFRGWGALLSGARALRVCLPRCLGPPLVLPLCVCVCVSVGTHCPLCLGKGSGSLSVLGNQVAPGFWAGFVCMGGGGFILFCLVCLFFCQRRSFPLGRYQRDLFPVARTGPACHPGTVAATSPSRALGAKLPGDGCGPGSGLSVLDLLAPRIGYLFEAASPLVSPPSWSIRSGCLCFWGLPDSYP